MPTEHPIKLHDLRTPDCPSTHGSVFRSMQVFQCPICHARTNRVVIARIALRRDGHQVICPNAKACWHHELERRYRALERAILRLQIACREDAHDAFREDLDGTPDTRAPMQTVTYTATFQNDVPCPHRYDSYSTP